jgi:periplasmic divalent cation tolerance protein
VARPRARGGFVEVETTIPARFRGTTAKAFGADFVARRLAACVNAFAVDSSYWWAGKQESAREALLRFKTTRANAARLVRLLKAEHPYDVPYVAVFPLDLRSEAYARWVRAETREPRRNARGPRPRSGHRSADAPTRA